MYSHYNFAFQFTQYAELIKNSQWGFNIRFCKFFFKNKLHEIKKKGRGEGANVSSTAF